MRWESLNKSKLVFDELHPGQGIGRVVKRQSTLVHIKFKSHTIKYRKQDTSSLVPATHSYESAYQDPMETLVQEHDSLFDYITRFAPLSPLEV